MNNILRFGCFLQFITLVKCNSFNNPRLRQSIMDDAVSDLKKEEQRKELELEEESECPTCNLKGGGSISFRFDSGHLERERKSAIKSRWETAMMVGVSEENIDRLIDQVIVYAPEPFDRVFMQIGIDNPVLSQPLDIESMKDYLKDEGREKEIARFKLIGTSIKRCFRLTVGLNALNGPKSRWKSIIQNEWGILSGSVDQSILSSLQNTVAPQISLENLDQVNKEYLITEHDLFQPYYIRDPGNDGNNNDKPFTVKIKGGLSQKEFVQSFSGINDDPLKFQIKLKYPMIRKEKPMFISLKTMEIPYTRENPMPPANNAWFRSRSPMCGNFLRNMAVNGKAVGYQETWSCEDIDNCDYNRLIPKKNKVPVFQNRPVTGLWMINEKPHSGSDCRKSKMWKQEKIKCGIKLTNIWPNTLTPIKMRLLQPPKHDGEMAWLSIINVENSVTADFDNIDSQNPPKKSSMKESILNKVGLGRDLGTIPPKKTVCFYGSGADSSKKSCEKKFGSGDQSRSVRYSGTSWLSQYWSSNFKLYVRNPIGTALTPYVSFPITMETGSSSIWSAYQLSYSLEDSFLKQRQYYLYPNPPEKLEIKLDFEPEHPRVGDALKIFIRIENKESNWRMGNFFKPQGSLSHSFQSATITLTPTGHSTKARITGGIGLSAKINSIQTKSSFIRKPYALFKVTDSGRQCVRIDITPASKRKYYDNHSHSKSDLCITVAQGLRAKWKDKSLHKRVIELTNKKKSTPFVLSLFTGKAKLKGKVTFTFQAQGEVPMYRLGMMPSGELTSLSDINHDKCNKNCQWKVTFTPNLPCVFNKDTGKHTKEVRIIINAEYKIDVDTVVKITPPNSLRFIIRESDQKLSVLRDQQPSEYARLQKCRGMEKERERLSPPPKICKRNVSEEIKFEKKQMKKDKKNDTDDDDDVMVVEDCVPIDEIDSENELNEIIEEDESERTQWWNEFWQDDWTWQYAILGAAFVSILYDLSKLMGLINDDSVLVEALETIAEEYEAADTDELLLSEDE